MATALETKRFCVKIPPKKITSFQSVRSKKGVPDGATSVTIKKLPRFVACGIYITRQSALLQAGDKFMAITTEAIKEALSGLIDPVVGVDYVSGKMFKSAETDAEGNVTLNIELGYPARTYAESVGETIGLAVKNHTGAKTVNVNITQNIIAHKVQGTLRVLPNVKNIIAVSSGKGGVGKSTVSANLALALAYEGASVGVLDADIYGPSQPQMLGAASGKPVSTDGKTMEPITSLGLQINSIGFMVGDDEPMIWRGPMASGALQQLIQQTNWQELDYLIVDMPPGTGDIQLTLSQQVPLTGAVVVTTPQDIALIDAKKGLRMFQKVNVPILGVVENMSVFICPHCGEVEHIFGEGGAKSMCEKYGTPLLGELPLSAKIREQADNGLPTVAADPESPEAKIYRDVAMKVAGSVAKLGKDYSAKMPGIKVVHD